MAGIKDAITDLLAKLQTSSISFARVWNNQLEYIEAQQIEAIPFPCAFVEVASPSDYAQLAFGVTVSDIVFRVHVCAVEMDAADGTIGQNLSIFTLRDEIIALLTGFQLSGCSSLMKTSESQDYAHTNIYHYILEFTCSFIDNKGDSRQSETESIPPTVLEINPITIVTEITT